MAEDVGPIDLLGPILGIHFLDSDGDGVGPTRAIAMTCWLIASASWLFAALSRYPGLSARPETDNSDGMKPPPNPHYRRRFPAEIISHAVWLYHVFSLSLRDVELLLVQLSGALSSPTRPCGAGARNSAGASPTACAAAGHSPGLSGTSTRSSSGSRAFSTIFGGLWIRMALGSTSLFSNGAMPKPPSVSSDAS